MRKESFLEKRVREIDRKWLGNLKGAAIMWVLNTTYLIPLFPLIFSYAERFQNTTLPVHRSTPGKTQKGSQRGYGGSEAGTFLWVYTR